MPEDLTPQDGETVVSDDNNGGETKLTDGVKPEDKKVDASEADTSKDTTESEDGTETKEGSPETFADFVMPDGVELDKEAVEAFLPVAKELNLTQEQAQKLVDVQANMIKKANEDNQTAFTEQNDKWVETAKSDKEIGGAEFDAKMATAKVAVQRFGTQELLEVFDATGVGNHPEMIRLFYRVGKLMENDKVNFGNSSEREKQTAAQVLFPDMPKE